MSRAPILNPKLVPVSGTDAHLPPVPLEALQPQALRQRFAAPPAWQLELPGDGGRIAERAPAAAAVLVPLVLRAEGPQVLLTRRTAHLRDHAGQISFPGGRIEPGDGSAAAAALREAEEEIALHPSFAEPLGLLDPYETGTGYRIEPVVALVRTGFALKADPREVAGIFEAPFAFLMDAANHQRHSGVWKGRERHYYAIPYGERYIWGATAGMLVNLYERLGPR